MILVLRKLNLDWDARRVWRLSHTLSLLSSQNSLIHPSST